MAETLQTETEASLKAKLNFNYIVIGGEKDEGEYAESMRLFSSLEHATEYADSIRVTETDNLKYGYTKILKTDLYKHTDDTSYAYIIIGGTDGLVEDAKTIKLFNSLELANHYAKNSEDDYTITYLIKVDGTILEVEKRKCE